MLLSDHQIRTAVEGRTRGHWEFKLWVEETQYLVLAHLQDPAPLLAGAPKVQSRIEITGWNPEHLNPASYDVTLSPRIRRVVTRKDIDLPPLKAWDPEPEHTELIDMGPERLGGTYTLNPGEFILGATNEIVGLDTTLAARVEGKSSLGRLGLQVHSTAGFIDPGFRGSVTLEICNTLGRPLTIRPNMRIAQLAFMPMLGVPEVSYAQVGRYQGQSVDKAVAEPVESKGTVRLR